MMWKTINQKIAALVLVGGVIALVTFLLLAFTIPLAHFDLALTWYIANDLAVYQLINEDYRTGMSFFERYSYTAIAALAAFILSYSLGLLLALQGLFKTWRDQRKLRALFTPNRLIAVLVLLTGAFYCGLFIRYMDFYNLKMDLAWLNIQIILTTQLSVSFVEARNRFADLQIRAANVTMAALALSYVLSLALAVGTLWQGRRTSDMTTE